MKIIECLKNSPVITSFEVLELKTFKDGFFIKIKATVKDGSTLYIREYVDAEERNYSYHWQDKRGKLIVRWDNAPHHRNLRTYPHHKHEGSKVKESFETTCEKILKAISNMLK